MERLSAIAHSTGLDFLEFSLTWANRWDTVSAWIAESTKWLLSITIIERVRRPCVASMRRRSSFASSFSRFMGAELGDTIATTRSATTVLPKPIFSKTCSILPPFDFYTIDAKIGGRYSQGVKITA
jgi:hypothetical protein